MTCYWQTLFLGLFFSGHVLGAQILCMGRRRRVRQLFNLRKTYQLEASKTAQLAALKVCRDELRVVEDSNPGAVECRDAERD